jgi:hypothetical protein
MPKKAGRAAFTPMPTMNALSIAIKPPEVLDSSGPRLTLLFLNDKMLVVQELKTPADFFVR